MQFLAPTFAEVVAHHPLPPGGASPQSLYNPHDAVYAAAAYLCDNGAATNLHNAIFQYNHAEWYVSEVIAQAAQYGSDAGFGADTTPSNAALAAVTYAQGQLGIPYLWGGNGPQDGGWDCSGLTHAAYEAAGIELPRTAQTQYDAGPAVLSVSENADGLGSTRRGTCRRVEPVAVRSSVFVGGGTVPTVDVERPSR